MQKWLKTEYAGRIGACNIVSGEPNGVSESNIVPSRVARIARLHQEGCVHVQP